MREVPLRTTGVRKNQEATHGMPPRPLSLTEVDPNVLLIKILVNLGISCCEFSSRNSAHDSKDTYECVIQSASHRNRASLRPLLECAASPTSRN